MIFPAQENCAASELYEISGRLGSNYFCKRKRYTRELWSRHWDTTLFNLLPKETGQPRFENLEVQRVKVRLC